MDRNASDRKHLALLFVMALPLVAAFSGCVHQVRTYYDFDPDTKYVNPGVFPGRYASAGPNGSAVLVPGQLRHGDPQIIRLRSDRPGGLVEVPTVEGENFAFIKMAVWVPIGSDEQTFPLIVEAGPYFENGCLSGPPPCGEGNQRNIKIPQQATPFLLANYLPLGYAVAQIAVRGTGTSGGCMELLSRAEAQDLSQAITWLAEQEWSNGNVGMIGASYDGTTPWEVAALGNPNLKTIVPAASLPDLFGLMFHNGTSEVRGPIMHDVVYWPYGFDEDFPLQDRALLGRAQGREDYQNRQNLQCPEVVKGAAMGVYSFVQGDRGEAVSTYWTERDRRDAVLQNYKGSVFLIHGLQDWNVEPHAVIPFNAELRAHGIEVKEWYGQWDHAFPDSRCQPKTMPLWLTLRCRVDYAETLLHWFDYYLNGNTTRDLGPALQIQDDRGYWRNAASFPPAADWVSFYPDASGAFSDKPGAEASVLLAPPVDFARAARATPLQYVEFQTAPFLDDTRVSGLPQFHVEFEAQGPGGYLGAWVFDENATGHVLSEWAYSSLQGKAFPIGIPIVAHAQMDLRFYEGGETSHVLRPGERHTARMEFEPLDILVPKGHRLSLWLFQYEYPDHFGGPVPAAVKVFVGGDPASVLRLPTIELGPADIFVVPGVHFPDPATFERHNVPKPTFQPLLPASWDAFGVQGACRDLAGALRDGAAAVCRASV